MALDNIKWKLVDWLISRDDGSMFVRVLHERPEMVLSITKLSYGDMVVRMVDGREIDIPPLPESYLDQVIGFERDRSERLPTWINILSVVAVNAAIEMRALNALHQVAHRLGYELRERPSHMIDAMDRKRRATEELEVGFVDELEDRKSS
jgi:hypothetical protein